MQNFYANKYYHDLCSLLASPASTENFAHLKGYTPDDWQELQALAINQRVISLLYCILKDHVGEMNIPRDILQTIRHAHQQQAGRQVAMFHELGKILSVLHHAEIPVVLLKGIDLANSLYPDPSLRPIGDLDVLMPYERIEEAIARILPMDYQLEFSWSMPEIRKGQKEAFYTEANLDKQSKPYAHLELHWRLVTGRASRYAADPEWFWQGARPAAFEHIPCLVLSPERNALYLAGHAAIKHVLFKHGQGGVSLMWYYDLHLLLTQKTDEIDWDELLTAARRFGWNTALYLALTETQQRFGTPLPDAYLSRLQSGNSRREIALWNGEVKHLRTRSSDSMEDFRFLKPRMKWWLVRALIFPGKAYMLHRYQPKKPGLWPLYYFYRWYDIATDLLGSVKKRLLNTA
ncbi:nucleotidyltransferase family protein [candidate division KSB1 bacterium]|nr:nucleotidyltransferase family protein [candidate division KSB1 bacterium]